MAGVLVGVLQIVDVGPDVDVVRRRESAGRRVERREARRRLRRDVDLERRGECPVAANVLEEFGRQLSGIDQPVEQDLAARVAGDRPRLEFARLAR